MMATRPATAPWTRQRRRKPARRRGARPWAITGPEMAQAMLSTLPSLPRATLARITERLIDRMDEIDGDPDREDDDPDEEHDGAEMEMGALALSHCADQALMRSTCRGGRTPS